MQHGLALTPATRTASAPVRLVGEVKTVEFGHSGWVRGTLVSPSDGAHYPFVGHTDEIIEVGSSLSASGVVVDDPDHGVQVRLVAVKWVRRPTRKEAIVRYITANLKGCGPVKAARIAEHFGADALEVLAREPERICEALPNASDSIVNEWVAWAHVVRGDIARFRLQSRLLKVGVEPGRIASIVRFFKDAEVAEILSIRQPYRLLHVPGIGWEVADRIALKLGVGRHSRERIGAATRHALVQQQAVGHSAFPLAKLAWKVGCLIGASRHRGAIASLISEMIGNHTFVERDGLVFLPEAASQEEVLSDRLAALATRRIGLSAGERIAIEDVARQRMLSPEQRGAIERTLASGVSLLSGLPGSGKTTALCGFVDICRLLGKRLVILTPTGKSAARASEVTGVEASTIHRALGVPVGMRPDQPIDADVLVVDEAGMLDLEVGEWLVGAIDPLRTQIVFVGDNHQLPSVGHGNFFGDLIESEVIPASTLILSHRHREGHDIANFARALLTSDQRPNLTQHPFVSNLPKLTEGDVLSAVHNMEKMVGVRNFTVLAPIRRRLGVEALNRILQNRLNPSGSIGPFIAGGVRVREGDRVIQTRNLYQVPTPVFNGEAGTVIGVGSWQGEVRVDFGSKVVVFSGHHLLQLELAWALTVHRSQGSEYDGVVLVLDRGYGDLLNRQLVYTAVTRAKRHLMILNAGGGARSGSPARCFSPAYDLGRPRPEKKYCSTSESDMSRPRETARIVASIRDYLKLHRAGDPSATSLRHDDIAKKAGIAKRHLSRDDDAQLRGVLAELRVLRNAEEINNPPAVFPQNRPDEKGSQDVLEIAEMDVRRIRREISFQLRRWLSYHERDADVLDTPLLAHDIEELISGLSAKLRALQPAVETVSRARATLPGSVEFYLTPPES